MTVSGPQKTPSKPLVLNSADSWYMTEIRSGNATFDAPWERAVEYLVAHAGRFVPGWELGDAVYGGACSRTAVPKAIAKARRYFRIEGHQAFGYRIGRQDAADATCPKCNTRRVRYRGEWVCYECIGTHAADLEVGRAPYEEGTNQGKQWNSADDTFLRQHYRDMCDEDMAQLLNRSHSGVRARRKTLKLGKKPYVMRKLEESA